MSDEHTNNRAYLVRGWQEGKSPLDGTPVWRFSLEEVLRARHRFGFGSLEALLAFLREELSGGAEEEQGPSSKFQVASSKSRPECAERLQPETSNHET